MARSLISDIPIIAISYILHFMSIDILNNSFFSYGSIETSISPKLILIILTIFVIIDCFIISGEWNHPIITILILLLFQNWIIALILGITHSLLDKIIGIKFTQGIYKKF
ncbi:hypothetical protein HYT51_00195 [Candidatus Woesearchaeota archaeon]|nr:hypothetical protein [Candidatus Woesearchaeota archaeon]